MTEAKIQNQSVILSIKVTEYFSFKNTNKNKIKRKFILIFDYYFYSFHLVNISNLIFTLQHQNIAFFLLNNNIYQSSPRKCHIIEHYLLIKSKAKTKILLLGNYIIFNLFSEHFEKFLSRKLIIYSDLYCQYSNKFVLDVDICMLFKYNIKILYVFIYIFN